MKEKKNLVSCTEFMIGPFNHIGICCCNWLVNEMKDKVQSGMKELILIVSFFGLYRSNKGRTVLVCVQKQK